MDKEIILIENVSKVHTTKMGAERIRKNLSLASIDVVDYCKSLILKDGCNITKRGKNYYCEIEDVIITVNSHSFTIITAHRAKGPVSRSNE